jgi:hypothetical protein
VALAAWFVVGSAGWRWTAYGDWLALDASFRGGLDRLAEIRRERPDESVQFQAHPEVFAAYRFVTANPARNFWRFAGAQLPTDGSHPIGVQLAGCGGQGTVIVRLDERMRPVATCPAR